MNSRFRASLFYILAAFFLSVMTGCFSYRILREADGNEVLPPVNDLRIGETTLKEALRFYGAPDRVVELDGKNLLIYERSLFYQNSIAFGIPISDATGSSISFSTYGNLTRYDTLILFFTADDILENIVFEKGTEGPFLETLLDKK
ncbi:MAG: hypothetical protein V1714_05885 [Pseudomonadota bacterium]